MITISPLRLAFYAVLATVFTSAAFAQDRNQCLSRIDVYVPKDPADQYDKFVMQDTLPTNDEERFDKTWLDAAEPDAWASEEVKKYKLLGSYSYSIQNGPKTFWAKNDFGDEGPTETICELSYDGEDPPCVANSGENVVGWWIGWGLELGKEDEPEHEKLKNIKLECQGTEDLATGRKA